MKYYGLIMPSVFPTGIFIQDIKQTASSNESEGVNTMTITLTNQQKAYFNIKNGKQGSSVEATAEMERHAKKYIARELTEQKIALEHAIENGEIAIKDSIIEAKAILQSELAKLIQKTEEALQDKVDKAKKHIDSQLSIASKGIEKLINTKVNEAMATSKSVLMATINKKFIEHYEKGYLQMPGMPSPLEDTSMHYIGYSWYEVKYNGNFFRAKGRNAKAFTSKKLSEGNLKRGEYIFSNDEQDYVFKGFTGDFGTSEYHLRNLTFIFWVLVKNESYNISLPSV